MGFDKLGDACMGEEEERFHGLPPLKRFKLLEKERVGQNREKEVVVRRKMEPVDLTESVNLRHENDLGIQGVKVCCLPAKKRVCALRVFTVLPDEEVEQENRELLAKKKIAESSAAVHALRPINSNRQVPVSMKPDGKSIAGKELKKRRESSYVVTRASLQPISNRQVSVPVEPAEKGAAGEEQDNEAKLAEEVLQLISNRHVSVTVEAAPTGEKQKNEVKLLRKKREANSVPSNPLQHDSSRQPSAATVPLEGEGQAIEVKLARMQRQVGFAPTNTVSNQQLSVARKGEEKIFSAAGGAETEVKLANIRRQTGLTSTTDALLSQQVLITTGGNGLHNRQMLVASGAEEQQKKTETAALQPICDWQVSDSTGQNDQDAASALEENCPDEEEEESDGEDDGVFCDVCREADAEPSDPIVFCDGCNVMVHASCYGSPLIDGIPDGDWFCRQCESERRRKKVDENTKGNHVGFHVGQRTCARVCCLCPSRKGVMKRTTGGAWAHLSCALFVPEVFYKRARDREGIVCSSVPAWRRELPCVVCLTLGQGSCIQCTEVGCSSTFHVSCALDAGLTIDYRNANALTKTPAIVIAFCPSHSSQALTRSERGRFKIVPRA